MKNVFVFGIEDNNLVVLDTDEKQEIHIDITNYDKEYLKTFIGNKILIEKNGEKFEFAGTSLLRIINEFS